MIQSTVDSFSIKNIVVANCTKKGPPYSLDACDQESRKVIEQYRLLSIEAIK